MVIDGCAPQLAGAEHQRAWATMGQHPQRSEIAPAGQRDRHLQHAIAVRIEQEVLAVGVQSGEQGLVIRHPAINEDQIRGRPAVDPHVLHHSIVTRTRETPARHFDPAKASAIVGEFPTRLSMTAMALAMVFSF
jgi:hypothetical protein